MGVTVDISVSSVGVGRCRVRIFDDRVEFSVNDGEIRCLRDEPLVNILKDIFTINIDGILEEYRKSRISKAVRPKNSARKDLRIFIDGAMKAAIDCYVVGYSDFANRYVNEIFYLLGINADVFKRSGTEEKVARAEILRDYDLSARDFVKQPTNFQCLAIRDKLDGMLNDFYRNRILDTAKEIGELSPRQNEAFGRANECLRNGEFAECYFAIWDYWADRNSNSRQFVVYEAEAKKIRPVMLGLKARVNQYLQKKRS